MAVERNSGPGHKRDDSEDSELHDLRVTICDLCLYGEGGECHTPGCMFWVCPAPDAEQAERFRQQRDLPFGDTASRDRRELWHLESFLAVNGTNPGHHERGLRLRRYLCETCEHKWRDVSGWMGCPEGTRQCSWCCVVSEPGGDA